MKTDYGAFGQPIWTEADYLQAELERIRFQTEHPEEYATQQEKKRKAEEAAQRRIEAAKNLPPDYFDGWELYEVKPGDSLWTIAKKYLGSGTKCSEIAENNDQQLPFKGYSIKPGMKLRIKRI